MDGKEKTCKNCKYYVEHYMISRCMTLVPFGGHCKYSVKKKNPIDANDCCGHWERKENLSAAVQKTLTALLRDTEKRLEQIQLMLSLINK